MGLADSGRIGRIIVHPTDANIVYACVLGRATGPQQERGVYKTTDGGQTWKRTLFVNPDTGCSGLAIDAKDPNVLIAGTWDVVLHTWAMFSGGPGSGVYISKDAGETWKKIDHPGLPKSPVGKIDVAIAPSNSNRMYALIQTASQGSLWRSDDAGVSWKVVSWDRTLIGRAGYYIRLAVSPTNPDEVHAMSSSPHRSTDGGVTFTTGGGGCGDCHDIWIDPKNPDHWVQTGDSTMGITTNHGRSFTPISLPIGQMYHVAVDNRIPYWVYSNRQDDGTMRGPSDAPVAVPNVPSYGRGGGGGRGRGGGGGGGRGEGAPAAAAPGARGAQPGAAPAEGRGGDAQVAGPGVAPPPLFEFGGGRGGSDWEANLGGCESGFTIPVPSNPDVVWASCYGNEVTRWDARTKRARSVAPWLRSLDSPPNELKYRCHWTPPLVIDPFDHKTVYYGCQMILKTSNDGQSWTEISPDLSTQDPKRNVSSGGIIGDNLGQFYGEVVFAIAPSEVQRGLIWAGTNDGKVWYTSDGGGKWNDVSKNISGLPEWGSIAKIEPSHFDAGTAYVVADFHLMENRNPFIFRTTDFGKTWTKISDGLPQGHPLAYARSFAENPNRKGMLFAGTGNGFYYSMDDGARWTKMQTGLPAAPVTWIVVQKQFHDVVVSTYGRGLYILDDITPLEQSTPTSNDAVRLFVPRPGFRLARSGRAQFNYNLREASTQPVVVEVLDSTGAVIRSLQGTGRAGLNRVNWDLRYEPAQRIEMRTKAPDNPNVWDEPRFRGRDTRPIIHWGVQAQPPGPLAAPGKYSVRLKVAGQTLTQPFDIIKDPDVETTDTDLTASTQAQIRVRDALDASAGVVNSIEVMRKEVEDQSKAPRDREVARILSEMDKKLMDVELQLLSRSDMQGDDKFYVEAYKVYLNLLWLSNVLGNGGGDTAGGADFRPTDATLKALEGIEKELKAAKDAYQVVIEKDVPAFNRVAPQRGLTPLTVKQK
jgi:photosystem II stability/assembly factor-like uncharacterized protein